MWDRGVRSSVPELEGLQRGKESVVLMCQLELQAPATARSDRRRNTAPRNQAPESGEGGLL